MKKTLSILFTLFLIGCTPQPSTVDETSEISEVSEVAEISNDLSKLNSIEEYIDVIHLEGGEAENAFFFEYGTKDYSIEGYELIMDDNGDPQKFGNNRTKQYDNAFFWIYAESDYQSTADGLATFYLRGLEAPRDAVYGPFKGKLAEMVDNFATNSLTENHKNSFFFERENDKWVLYSLETEGKKEATGLKVAVQKNENLPESEEEIYQELSPDGKQIAYMQKPAWPHQIYIANIDGTQIKELLSWDNMTPTHANVENQFIWSAGGKSLLYSITTEDCGPGGSGGIRQTVFYKQDITSGEEEHIAKISKGCNEATM